FSVTPLPLPTSPLFPYTTLFRSIHDFVKHPFFSEVAFNEGHVSNCCHRQNIRSNQGAFVTNHTTGHLRPTTWGTAQINHGHTGTDRKSTRLNSSHVKISYAVFCL